MTRPRLGPNGPSIDFLHMGADINNGNGGAAATIDWTKGNNQRIQLNAPSCLVTSTGLPLNETASLTLLVSQDGTGGRLLVFDNAVIPDTWLLSTAPSAVDLVDLLWNGGVLFASIRGKRFG